MENVKVFALSVLAVFAPVQTMVTAALVLIIIDLITGLVASYKRKDKITSAVFSRTLIKTLVYETAIITAFLAEKYLTGDTIKVTNIVTTFIGMGEAISIMENLNEISGGSLLKALIAKLGSQNAQDQK